MKYLVLGDIHNEYKSLMDAHIYAREYNLTIISVGDVVATFAASDLDDQDSVSYAITSRTILAH